MQGCRKWHNVCRHSYQGEGAFMADISENILSEIEGSGIDASDLGVEIRRGKGLFNRRKVLNVFGAVHSEPDHQSVLRGSAAPRRRQLRRDRFGGRSPAPLKPRPAGATGRAAGAWWSAPHPRSGASLRARRAAFGARTSPAGRGSAQESGSLRVPRACEGGAPDGRHHGHAGAAHREPAASGAGALRASVRYSSSVTRCSPAAIKPASRRIASSAS